MIVPLIIASMLVGLQGSDRIERFPKIIWTYWDDGIENAPLITQLCIENMNRTATKEGWQLKILSNKTYLSFINDKDRFNNMIKNSKVSMGVQKKADVIRLFLLHEHGGVWADANTFFIQQFKWISKIEQQTQIDNKFGLHPDALLFSYQNVQGDLRIELIDGTQNSKVRVCPQNEMWFIAALPGVPIIKDWLAQFQRYILNGFQYVQYTNRKDGILIGQFLYRYGNDFLLGNRALQAIIQQRQHNLTANQIQGQPKRYAVHDYKIWTIQSRISGYHITYFTDSNQAKAIRYLLQYTQDQIKEVMGLPRYFIKMYGGFYRNTDLAIARTQQAEKPSFLFKLMHIFDQVYLSCDINLPYQYIVKDSLIDKYLFQGSEILAAKQMITYSKDEINNKCSIDYLFYLLVAIMSIPFWPVVLFSLYCFVVRPIKWISGQEEYNLVEKEVIQWRQPDSY